jgi:hypothetical protein
MVCTCWSLFFFGTFEAYFSGEGLLLHEVRDPLSNPYPTPTAV